MGASYGYHKSLASFLRMLVKPRLHLDPKPDEVAFIPSRDDGRTIRTHIYKPATTAPTPVVINFCGSGFVLATFGNDDEYCRYVTDKAGYTVIDVRYRLAPEHPFPAAVHDAEDVVTWVRSQPERFDLSLVSLSGFSAGANIALGVASSSELFPCGEKSIFNAVISFYGPMDMSLPTPEKPQADRSNWIMRDIFPGFSNLCHKCLFLGGADPKDPRMSPILADPKNFPANTLMVTAAQDPFAIEAETLSETLNRTEGKYSVCQRMDNCAHGWDKEAIRGSSQCDAKIEAYDLAVDMLMRRAPAQVAKAAEVAEVAGVAEVAV
jgi:acetyl esterase/lipase